MRSAETSSYSLLRTPGAPKMSKVTKMTKISLMRDLGFTLTPMNESSDLLKCPECGAEVQPAGRLGVGQIVGDQAPKPEPWRDVATCPSCGSELERYEGQPWRLATS